MGHVKTVVCVLVLGGCGDDGGNARSDARLDPDAPVGMATIGAAGGALVSSDGVLELTVPAGALAADTTLTIDILPESMWHADVTAADPVGPVYSMGPEGTVFVTPATLTWRFATAPANASVAGNPSLLFGHSRSAAGTIERYGETLSTPSATGALQVLAPIAHLSEHFLSTRIADQSSTSHWGPPVGSVVIENGPRRHAIDVPWSATRMDLLPTDTELGVFIQVLQTVPAPIMDISLTPWNGSAYRQATSLTAGQLWMPSVAARYKCTAPGITTITTDFHVAYGISMSDFGGWGKVTSTQEIECFEREQKPEYTTETTALTSARIAPLAVPATTTVNLADHQGAYGWQVCMLAGQTIRSCVGASMAAGINYYPQYPPGYTFLDGAPGCTDITNIDTANPNCVLVKVTGSGSPNNATVTTSLP